MDAGLARAYRQLGVRGPSAVRRRKGLLNLDLWMTWQAQYPIAGRMSRLDLGEGHRVNHTRDGGLLDHAHLMIDTRKPFRGRGARRQCLAQDLRKHETYTHERLRLSDRTDPSFRKGRS